MKNAVSWMHIDAAGFATAVENIIGSKYWVVANRSRDLAADRVQGRLSSMHCFGSEWDPLNPVSEDYKLEGVVLKPGTML